MMIWVGMILGCSDYNLLSKVEPEADAVQTEGEDSLLSPVLVVDPMSVAVEGVCESDDLTQQINILNAGGVDLEISDISLAATGWTLEPVSLPLTIAPSTMETLTLNVGTGTGILTILSNDPQEPSLWVDLFAAADTPPSISIDNPMDGAIIPTGGVDLQATITELEDTLESLSVAWHSNVDGFIAESAVNASGTTIFPFEATTYGNHEIAAVVQDSCGSEATDAITVCQQFGYEAENLDISTWHFEGSANWDSSTGVVELTEPIDYSAGTAFSTGTEVNAESVEIEFQFFVSGGSGADGFSLTALDTSRMTGFVGDTGGGIGYGGLPGWSIEVDTYHNGSDPTSEDHVALSFDGNVHSPAIWAPLPEMEDGQWHTMRVVVAAPNVLVEIDGVAYLNQSVSGNFSFMSYIGFTAGTGSFTNFHLIDALTVSEVLCE